MNKLQISIALVIIALVFVGYGMFSIGSIKVEDSFKVELDRLNNVNDSLTTKNEEDSYKIAELQVQDSIFKYNISRKKTRTVVIDRWVDSSKERIDTYSEHELVSSFNKRYPTDTVTNTLPVAQLVLASTAKDLIELDGAKEELGIKDSVIAIQESRITLKDSTIKLYINKEERYKATIGNKEQAIAEWTKQYGILNLTYKKAQVKSKFQKIGSYIIIGGLAYALLAK
jgi:hypothetical protein